MLFIQPITGLLTDAISGATLPLPSAATDGLDIKSWRKGVTPIGYDAATVYLTASAAATLGDSTNPVYLCGYKNSSWWLVGVLDGGSPMVFPTGGLAIARRLGDVGVFERLAIACAVVTGSKTYTYRFEPISQHVCA